MDLAIEYKRGRSVACSSSSADGFLPLISPIVNLFHAWVQINRIICEQTLGSIRTSFALKLLLISTSTTLFFPLYVHFCFCILDVGVDIQLLFCKFLFLAFPFLWTLWLVEYPFLLLQHDDCPMRLLTIYHHFTTKSKMACGSGSRTN